MMFALVMRKSFELCWLRGEQRECVEQSLAAPLVALKRLYFATKWAHSAREGSPLARRPLPVCGAVAYVDFLCARVGGAFG